jgi:hypothetical protein
VRGSARASGLNVLIAGLEAASAADKAGRQRG